MRSILACVPCALFVAFGLAACGGDSGSSSPPGPDFRKDTDVVVSSPTNGETVDSPFVLEWTAGADVSSLRLDIDGETDLSAIDVGDGQGQLVVRLDVGRHRLDLVGLDEHGATLSDYALSLRVDDGTAPWVTITSPGDGAVQPNPVTFVVDASDEVQQVELLADGWSIGTVKPGQLLSYEFSGTGYARTIEARGSSADGELLATDSISLTVDPSTDPLPSTFNDTVLALVAGYPTDGSYGYYWPSGGSWYGTTQDLWYLDSLVATGDPEHLSYCSGITWETFMRAWQEIDRETGGDGSLNGLSVADLDDFRVDWFVRDLYGDGPGVAVLNYGIGEPVTRWQDVRPGDYVQIWRHSGSGHTFVFIDWLRDDSDNIIGVQYWSSQGSTDGISENEEYFGTSGSTLDPSFFYATRVYPPQDWIPWH